MLKGIAKENTMIKIYDELSGKLIMSTKVDIITKNTIQCITAPCPSNEMTTPSKSNESGEVEIKYEINTFDGKRTILKPKGHYPKRLTDITHIKNSKALTFKPLSLTKDDLKIEIIQKNKNVSLAGKKVIFSTDKVGENILYETKINALNILFYPYSKVFPKGLAQTEPVYVLIEGFPPKIRYQHWREDPIKLD